MLFRPSYCCKCGERIERGEWRLWTSRRFCPVCETDHKLSELITRGIVGLSALVLVVGAVNYLFAGRGRKELALTRAPVVAQANEPPRQITANTQIQPPANAAPLARDPQSESPAAPPRTLAALPTKDPPQAPGTAVSSPIYYCGAETKKGTPCSRKVKGNVRCWQHAGMPAMLPADKLLVSR